MKRITIFISMVFILILAACSSPIPAPQPTNTATAPAPTETSIPPTLEPSPTADPLLFKDEFEESLGEGWNWTKENKKTWSLTNNPGWLEIIAGRGHVGSGDLDNVLLRSSPSGNFEIETKVNFDPQGNYQFAGLLIYESAANYVQFGRSFCDNPNSCVKDGFYFDSFYDGNIGPENFATAAQESEIAYLRLRREGNKYTAYASYDGEEWRLLGENTNELKPLFIGLMAGQTLSGLQPAQFDYFVVNQLP